MYMGSGHIFMSHPGKLFGILKNFVAVKSAPNVHMQKEQRLELGGGKRF